MNELDFYRQVAVAATANHLDAVLRGALNAALELTGATRGAVVLTGPGGEALLHARVGSDEGEPGLSQSLLARVLADGETVRLENALDEPLYRSQPSVKSLNLLSVLAVPLTTTPDEGGPPGTVVGAMYLDSSRVSGIFTPEHQQVIERFCRHLAPQLARARETLRLEARVRELERQLALGDGGLLGESPLVLELRDAIRRVGPSEAPVLIAGESGTGKELCARALHAASPRAKGPLVAVNCGALPDELLESELFGHLPGSFTGAHTARKGRFAAADGGTIFLDEVGELSGSGQAALLRVLETGELQVVGADQPTRVSVRVVAATNRDLAAEAEAGRFRDDLFYRLSVVQLEVPPLRTRGEDVLLLAEHFLLRFASAEGKGSQMMTDETKRLLLAHDWPGNVRELQNAVRRAVLFARDGEVQPGDLPPALRAPASGVTPPPSPAPRTKDELEEAKATAVDALEREFVLAALERSGGNVAQASRETGLHRSVVHRILKRIKG